MTKPTPCIKHRFRTILGLAGFLIAAGLLAACDPSGPAVRAGPAGTAPPSENAPSDGDGWTADYAAALVFLWHVSEAPQGTGSVVPSTPAGDGFYDSADPATAAYHLDLMEEADANLLLLSWWGTGDDGFSRNIDRAADVYIAEADERDMAWAVFWEATNRRDLNADLLRIAEMTANEDYLRIDGEPVVIIYNRAWRQLTEEQLRALDEEYLLILEKFPKPEMLADGGGWTYWDIPWTDEEELRAKYAAVDDADQLFMAFIQSGLDNTALREAEGEPGTVWPTGEGASADWFAYQADLAAEYQPEIVATPLNELGEHSAVEPTVDFGRELTDQWGENNRAALGID